MILDLFLTEKTPGFIVSEDQRRHFFFLRSWGQKTFLALLFLFNYLVTFHPSYWLEFLARPFLKHDFIFPIGSDEIECSKFCSLIQNVSHVQKYISKYKLRGLDVAEWLVPKQTLQLFCSPAFSDTVLGTYPVQNLRGGRWSNAA